MVAAEKQDLDALKGKRLEKKPDPGNASKSPDHQNEKGKEKYAAISGAEFKALFF